MRAQYQVSSGELHIFHRGTRVISDGIHVLFLAPVGLQGVVMPVDQHRGSWQQARIHTHAVGGIDLDQHKTQPAISRRFQGWAQAAKKALLELENVLDSFVGDDGFTRGNGSLYQQHVLEIVVAGWDDAGPLVDLTGINQVKHRDSLDRQDTVHGLQAKEAFAIEEVGDVGLLEAGLPRQPERGEFPAIDPLQQLAAQIFLQLTEFHAAKQHNWMQ